MFRDSLTIERLDQEFDAAHRAAVEARIAYYGAARQGRDTTQASYVMAKAECRYSEADARLKAAVG